MSSIRTSKLSILAVDETALYRKFLAEAITATPGAKLAGIAANGVIASQKLGSLKVDLILLGLGADKNLATFHSLRNSFPELAIIITGSMNEEELPASIKAAIGDSPSFLVKPERLDLVEAITTFSNQLRHLLDSFADRPIQRRETVPAAARAPAEKKGIPARPVSGIRPSTFDLIAVAVSTGGPAALAQLIPLLPADLGVPILIVQHMPAFFTASLAESLNAKSELTVKEAENGDTLRPNMVYLAAGGRHMIVRRGPGPAARLEIGLHDDPPLKSCRPSADILFQSLAENSPGAILAVIMTGMGDDGADGIRRLKQNGECYCLSQSRESCVVYGMPRAVEINGLSDEVLPLRNLATRITTLVRS